MELDTCVSAFYQMLLELSSAFTRPTAETFRQLAVAWLLTPGVGPVTGMTRTLGMAATKHWTAYQKFFYRASWTADDVARQVLVRLVAPLLGSTVALNIDDTTCGPRGRHTALAGWFKDASAHARTQVIHWAHQWVLGAITLRLKRWPGRRLALPVAFALYRKRADCDPAHPYATIPQLALRLVRQVAAALPGKRLFVAVDGLYAVQAFFGNLPPEVVAVSRLRKNAALRTADVPKRRGTGGGPTPAARRPAAAPVRDLPSRPCVAARHAPKAGPSGPAASLWLHVPVVPRLRPEAGACGPGARPVGRRRRSGRGLLRPDGAGRGHRPAGRRPLGHRRMYRGGQTAPGDGKDARRLYPNRRTPDPPGHAPGNLGETVVCGPRRGSAVAGPGRPAVVPAQTRRLVPGHAGGLAAGVLASPGFG